MAIVTSSKRRVGGLGHWLWNMSAWATQVTYFCSNGSVLSVGGQPRAGRGGGGAGMKEGQTMLAAGQSTQHLKQQLPASRDSGVRARHGVRAGVG